jgi:outer membrane biosynthesis protein TonB
MPEEARQLDLSGDVLARYDVAPDGTVAGVEVDPRAEPVLAEAVRSWLRGCLFDPAVQDGRSVPGHAEQTFRFVLVDR